MTLVDSTIGSWITVLSGVGVIAGLGLFVRGLRDYRAAIRVGDTATSTISSLAAGEVRIGGVIEAAYSPVAPILRYNTRIAQVPGVALAPIFGWRPREFFAAEPGEGGSPDTSLRPAR